MAEEISAQGWSAGKKAASENRKEKQGGGALAALWRRLQLRFSDTDTDGLSGGVFYIFIAVFAAVLLVNVFCGSGLAMDLVEHIHASWLVSTGKVPYRDFFEHHNPLLWYLFAPITQLFYRQIEILYAARLTAIAVWGVVIYQLYGLTRDYFGGRGCARYTLMLLFLLSAVWRDAQNLRPDTFMLAAMLAGIRFLFRYLDTQQRRELVWSFICWSAAFWFLQKALVPGAGFATAVLWLLWRRKIRGGDFLAAAAIAAALNGAVVFCLWQAGALEAWFKWNFLFNALVPGYLGDYTSHVGDWLPVYAVLLGGAAVRFFPTDDKGTVLVVTAVMPMTELFFFAPHPQYYAPFFLLAAPLAAQGVVRLRGCRRQAVNIILCVAAAVSLYTALPEAERREKWQKYVQKLEFILDNTAADELLLNDLTSYMTNLYNPDADYMWFSFDRMVKLAVLEGFTDFSYDETFKKTMPRFGAAGNIPDTMELYQAQWLLERNTRVYSLLKLDERWRQELVKIDFSVWPMDMDFVKAHYKWECFGEGVCFWRRLSGAAADGAAGDKASAGEVARAGTVGEK